MIIRFAHLFSLADHLHDGAHPRVHRRLPGRQSEEEKDDVPCDRVPGESIFVPEMTVI